VSAVELSIPEDPRRTVVWLVDDSELQGELGRRALVGRHDVRLFRNGATLLEALGSEDVPHLLVLDWHMPELSGLDVCRFVRETRDAAILPILILTATGGDDLAAAFEAGANDFVLKPFSPSELDARVSALIRSTGIHARLAEAERRLRVEKEFRERFMGVLAHDLRQPLNTIVIANHTIAGAIPSTPQLMAVMNVQRRAAVRMDTMIAELLDFTRSHPETGIPVDRQDTDLAEVARAVVDEMRVGHPDRSFRLDVAGPCRGHWDRGRLAQVCTNLVANAVEHSSSPLLPIDVRLEGRDDGVELTVANQGQPIPAELVPVLFDAFRRGDRASRKTGGLGLGLYIVQEIARAHGGMVAVQSDADATVFRLTLPRDVARISRRA
jgi:two-component system sensor histidine kinase/response regulator